VINGNTISDEAINVIAAATIVEVNPFDACGSICSPSVDDSVDVEWITTK